MASLSYNEIFSSFYQKVEAFDLIGLSDQQATAFLVGWLRAAANKPFVTALFTDLTLDDEIMVLDFVLKYQQGDNMDLSVVREVLALGVTIEWREPKVNSLLNISQVFGSSEEKFYAQSTHLAQLKELSQTLKQEQRQMIADRGYFNNTYLNS